MSQRPLLHCSCHVCRMKECVHVCVSGTGHRTGFDCIDTPYARTASPQCLLQAPLYMPVEWKKRGVLTRGPG